MDLEDFSLENICRACLKELENNKFGLLDIQSLEKMFYACTSMEIVEDDVYTKFLCKTCYNMIEKFYQFRTMCTESYSKLQNMLKAHNEENSDRTLVKSCERLKEDVTISIKEEIEFQDDQELNEDNSPSVKEETNCNLNEDLHDNLIEFEQNSEENNKTVLTSIKKSPNMLQCDLCPKKFFKESRLRAHKRTHEGLKPYACTQCDKQFNKNHLLTAHNEAAHSNLDKLYHCSEPGCEKSYTTKRVLDGHFRNVHILKGVKNSCVCDTCGKVLTNKANLKKHSYIHTGDLPFKCDKCPKRFTTRHKLKEHCMRHDGIKNFVCPHCGMKKTTRDELKTHINYHTKEKVHQCPHCSSTFLNTGNLQLHIRIVHQGVKAYSCTHCDRSFAKSGTLKHHIMTHTGEKPHECKSCGKRFIQVIALKMHLKRNAKCK